MGPAAGVDSVHLVIFGPRQHRKRKNRWCPKRSWIEQQTGKPLNMQALWRKMPKIVLVVMGAPVFLYHIHMSRMACPVLEGIPAAHLRLASVSWVSAVLHMHISYPNLQQLGHRRNVLRIGPQPWSFNYLQSPLGRI